MVTATADERYFLSLINQSRAGSGLSALQLETHLNGSADQHTGWMLSTGRFSHEGGGGSSPTARMRAAGLDLSGSWSTGENIAYVSLDNDGTIRDEIQQLHTNLMNSPSHRANLLSSSFELVGIGLKVGWLTVDGRSYKVLMATQNFAVTQGDYQLDTAPGTVPPRASLPNLAVADPVYADWVRFFDGELVRADGRGGPLSGTARGDDLRGAAGADVVVAGGGHDWALGGAGNDRLHGGMGSDFLLGQDGADLIRGNQGFDRISGGNGADRLFGDLGNDVLRGNLDRDQLEGGDGHDRLSGGYGDDLLRGGTGSDLLRGDAGRDVLNGQAGNDLIVGGTGNDVLRGGAGADRFVFGGQTGVDRIHDYNPAEDRILVAEAFLGGPVATWLEDHVKKTPDGVVIELAGTNRVHVLGADLTVAAVTDDIFIV
ncbi:CAP domain-containing protein [Paracoccus marinaquae]|uniref:SCP domain-containing protein n=1 Tax=Paracoccus marinaquae TaxID=2841926 RepID=A0ABS6AHE9_9RHOB|nr:CAP domain-containing protein [Paracoccus marinaquae]MBU3028791.1 hypothetical protein [Paracoccus marinaquae]